MTITILYFAAVRETLKKDRQTVELSQLPSSTVDGLWQWLGEQEPAFTRWRPHLRIAVNEGFATDDTMLADGDEIAIIPPVSGGHGQTLKDDTGQFIMTTLPLDPQEIEHLVERDDAGAVVTFTGRVRNHTGDRQVDYLVYEAYDKMALKTLVQASDEAKQQWPALHIAIAHRYGRLEIGEAAVVISVSSPHRNTAYEGSRYLIERLKQIVPIWKKEVSPDGEEWIGMGP